MLLLVLPALQQFTGVFNVRELDGDFVLNEKPDIYIQIAVETFIPNIYEYAKEPN